MELEDISPAEFRKLQLQVNILQRFLSKTFGSSFLDFCKQAQLSMTKDAGKSLPPLNKAQVSTSNGSGGVLGIGKIENSGNSRTTPGARRLPPPPLLHRPSSSSGSVGQTGGVPKGDNGVVAVTTRGSSNNAATVMEPGDNEQEDYYDDGNNDGIAQFIQPEAVFSNDEHGNSNSPVKRATNARNGVKRGHSAAFGYDESDGLENGDNMQLPEGTECIVLESDDKKDQGKHEKYVYQGQDGELHGVEDGVNNGKEMNDGDGGGYSYNKVENGLEVVGGDKGNYQTEELQTDDNVTFGTVITAQDTGIQHFKCSFCPRAREFKLKKSLKDHYLLNHSPTPPPFKCQCGRRFLNQSKLQRHEVVHTAERPYVCPLCKKDFKTKDDMNIHKVRIHAEKIHRCPDCPHKLFATPAEVTLHLKNYHWKWQQ